MDDITAFAEVSELEARWRSLDNEEKKRAKTLLGDSSQIIVSLLGHDVPEEKIGVAKFVVCNMVKRVMIAPVDQAALTSEQRMAGPFMTTHSFANPSGDLYLTSAEKRMLGIGKSHIGSIRPAIHDRTGGEIDGW